MHSHRTRTLLLLLLILSLAPAAYAQGKLTSPKEQFGFNIGDDYQLANYTQLEAYFKSSPPNLTG